MQLDLLGDLWRLGVEGTHADNFLLLLFLFVILDVIATRALGRSHFSRFFHVAHLRGAPAFFLLGGVLDLARHARRFGLRVWRQCVQILEVLRRNARLAQAWHVDFNIWRLLDGQVDFAERRVHIRGRLLEGGFA